MIRFVRDMTLAFIGLAILFLIVVPHGITILEVVDATLTNLDNVACSYAGDCVSTNNGKEEP